ncbi:SusE outer membrane protein [Aquiflexum balticum DSM 16537]|uniref:SusE outer membrane protein n=1 Tax=Aquiflexum balticum DSM 16537 TaxID=758820 RepID=A0A1W2H1R3_9BACT|nr:SusE domain-containing protein [Aquiflexum balticum]SMD42853.1 SusE outer membrane protein [Aquiflexum balticum DSM 16537]
MKTLNIKILSVFTLLCAWACTDPIETVISANPNAPALTSPSAGTSLILNQDISEETVIFAYNKADFGFPAAVNYTVQLVESGASFDNAMDIGNSNSNSVGISQANLNQRLIARGFVPDEATQVDIRVRAILGPTVDPLFSERVTMLVTPFREELTYARMYVPGDYQGWDPSNENTVIYSVQNNDIYEGFVHILGGSGAFKVNEEPNWDINYGGSNGVLERNGPDLRIAEPFGTFRITVDLNTLTYSIGTRRRWGIIGDATPLGWANDTPMNFDPVNNVLTITLDLIAGNFKFRAGDWAHNYGDTGSDGILDPDGANIPIPEAGNYTITMDWKVPGEISYEVIKN